MTGRDHFRTRAKSSRCGPHHSGIVRGPIEAHTGKRFGITYDWNRLVSDRGRTPQMGAVSGPGVRDFLGVWTHVSSCWVGGPAKQIATLHRLTVEGKRCQRATANIR